MIEVFRLDGCRDPGGCHCSMSATSTATGERLWGGEIPFHWVKSEDATRALAARDAEIERLQSALDRLHGHKFSERVYVAMLAEKENLTALVEKRERQLVWAASRSDVRCVANNLLWKDGTTTLVEPFDGSDAGLLAAIDEATERETE